MNMKCPKCIGDQLKWDDDAAEVIINRPVGKRPYRTTTQYLECQSCGFYGTSHEFPDKVIYR